MDKLQKQRVRTQKRTQRVRKHLKEISDRPRLHVNRSNKKLYAQIIDDNKGVTIASVTEVELDKPGKTKTERAAQLGSLLGDKAKNAKVTKVKFDRGSYKYHGRIKALAEAAREKGLEF